MRSLRASLKTLRAVAFVTWKEWAAYRSHMLLSLVVGPAFFLAQVFIIYFEESFGTLFKIIKSMDMKKFACAFIIKRIYLKEGESLTNFGFFFIRVIAKVGGIKSQ